MRRIESIIEQPFRHGIVERMPKDEYRLACGLNPSSLKQPSPLHVKHAYESVSESTDAMRLGTAVHTLCWEPDRFETDIAVWEEGARRGKGWAQFADDNEGKTILTMEQSVTALRVASALVKHHQVKRLATEGIAETAVFTVESDMQCRGCLDWLNTREGILCDLKVVNSVESRAFGAAVIRYGWDVSMACYRTWFTRETGKAINSVKFIAVESKPPHDVVVYDVPEAALDAGWNKARERIVLVRECIDSGKWPGIAGDQEQPLETPAWAMAEEMLEFVA